MQYFSVMPEHQLIEKIKNIAKRNIFGFVSFRSGLIILFWIMFKKTQDEQLDMFRQSNSMLSDRARDQLENKSSWNQVVYNSYVSKVDESIYSVLYTSDKGRPNASIGVLLGMMLIKELNGWSDEQLFDECMFNLRARSALGLHHMDQSVPVSSTYYDFRSKVAEYKYESGEDLIEQTFHGVCAKQIAALDISGRKIRMDSKLIQSNIARQNRLQFILETLRKAVENINIDILKSHFTTSQYELLSLFKEKNYKQYYI